MRLRKLQYDIYLKISDRVQSLEEKASIVDSFVAWSLDNAQGEADTQASGSY